MTRICMVCTKTYGEKCPQCGTIAQPFGSGEKRRYACSKKRCSVNTFPIGDGGETHGVCDECAKLTQEQREEIVRARLVVQRPVLEAEITHEGATAAEPGDSGNGNAAECERSAALRRSGQSEPALPVSGSRKTAAISHQRSAFSQKVTA